MSEDSVNWLGKLYELGQKCRFIPLIDVTDAPGSGPGAPRFKCTFRINEYSILVEQEGLSKKVARSSAARIAYEKICEKTNEPLTAPLDKLTLKLKELDVQDHHMTSVANFFKGIAMLGPTKFPEDMLGYSELRDIADELQCEISYTHDEFKEDIVTEFRFRCEIRPKGSTYPVITGFGSSLSSGQDARDKAVKQLVAVLRVYSQ